MHRGPVELVYSREWRHLSTRERSQRPQRVVSHDPQPNRRVGEALPNHRILDATGLRGELSDHRELVLEVELLAEGERATLEGQRAHRDLPTLVHLTNDVG